MRIIVHTKDFRLFLPVPLCAAGLAIRVLPRKAITDMQASLPPSVRPELTKEDIYGIYRECRQILGQYKGLEIIRVKARDGTFVSIKL